MACIGPAMVAIFMLQGVFYPVTVLAARGLEAEYIVTSESLLQMSQNQATHREDLGSQTLSPQLAAMLPTIIALSSARTFGTQPAHNRELQSQVTPGNFDTVNLNKTFYHYCDLPGTPEEQNETWDKAVTGNAQANRDHGFDRVTFCARKITADESCVNISAYYLPARALDRPTIIFIHGLMTSSTFEDPLVSGSWARNDLDYNVLIPDLRNHGLSQVTTGYRSWSLPEASDILGAIDCLESGCDSKLRQASKSSIGLHAVSAGAYQGYQVLALEPEIQGMWVDSGVFDLNALSEYGIFYVLMKQGISLPAQTISALSTYVVANMTISAAAFGFNTSYYPSNILATVPANNRKILLAHATNDYQVPYTQSLLAQEYLTTAGYDVSLWSTTVDGTVTACRTQHPALYDAHVDSKYIDPTEYISQMNTFWSRVFG